MFGPTKIFFDGKIGTSSPSHSFSTGPKIPWAEIPSSHPDDPPGVLKRSFGGENMNKALGERTF